MSLCQIARAEHMPIPAGIKVRKAENRPNKKIFLFAFVAHRI
jgi:hypothetical protein